MNRQITELLDFFIPRLCTGCSKKLISGESILCENCYNSLQRTSIELLRSEFERKFLSEQIIDDFYSPFIFEKGEALQSLIHELKYSKRFLYGNYLGTIIAEYAKQNIQNWEIDYIVPIPLHRMKKIERGYNQAYFIAKGISKKTKLKLKPGIIRRRRFTESQTQFSLSERKVNMEGAFAVKSKLNLNGKRILLVDDVITTGATTSEAGKLLKNVKAEKVFAVSAALAGR